VTPGTYQLIVRVQDGRSRAAVPVAGGEQLALREIVVERTP
jgi:hypothetical protein